MDKPNTRPTTEAARPSRSASRPPVRKLLLPARSEEFDPEIHLCGEFGSEGVQARVCARLRLLAGLNLTWITASAKKPLSEDLEALLHTLLSKRLAWRFNQGIETDLDQIRLDVMQTGPLFIFDELLCNAFDAHARANKRGPISLIAYTTVGGEVIVDISDDGIGIKSVHQRIGYMEVKSHAVSHNWVPFVEGELGVGLLTSRFLTELHGGSLEFLRDVYPGQKTTVRVSFQPGSLQISTA